MLPRNHPDRIQITFGDPRLVANAGLLLPATLAQYRGLPQLVQERLDLGGRTNTGDNLRFTATDFFNKPLPAPLTLQSAAALAPSSDRPAAD